MCQAAAERQGRQQNARRFRHRNKQKPSLLVIFPMIGVVLENSPACYPCRMIPEHPRRSGHGYARLSRPQMPICSTVLHMHSHTTIERGPSGRRQSARQTGGSAPAVRRSLRQMTPDADSMSHPFAKRTFGPCRVASISLLRDINALPQVPVVLHIRNADGMATPAALARGCTARAQAALRYRRA